MNESFCNYVRLLLGWSYTSSLHSAAEPQQGRNSCPLLRSCSIGSVILASRNVFHVVSALQSIVFIFERVLNLLAAPWVNKLLYFFNAGGNPAIPE